MPQLRVGLAQIDTTVGDLQGNADLVSAWTAHARTSGCHAVVFPEMTLTGYMPEDLVLRRSFVDASIALSPLNATNEVGNAHSFTITVTAFPAGTGTPSFATPVVSVSPSGATVSA